MVLRFLSIEVFNYVISKFYSKFYFDLIGVKVIW